MEPASVAELLDPLADEVPDQPALIGAAGSYTYGELEPAINRAARALMEVGIGPGDRVAASLRNDSTIVIAFLAAQRVGAIWVGIARPLAGPEKAYLLRDSGATTLLIEPELADAVTAEQTTLPDLGKLLLPSEWADLVSRQAEDRPDVPPIDPHGPAGISYTSGTTGFPKGAVHSQHNLLVPVIVGRRIGKPATVERQGVMLPLTSLNMMVLGPINSCYGRDVCICIDRSDAAGIAARIAEQAIGSVCVPPTIYHDLLTDSDPGPDALGTLIEPVSGGTQVPPELVDRFEQRFGSRIVSGYGMTEAPTSVAWTGAAGTGILPGACGRPVPQVEIAILDEAGKPVPSGTVGEITIAPASTGPFADLYTPMLGYWNKPEETARVLRDGRYHTGDMGSLTEDGELIISGRRSDLILRGGGNVYPAEVERVLRDHNAVGEAAVFGLPDERLGERVVAAVTLEGDVGEADLLEHCGTNLAKYKRPEFILVLERLPRNATGKLLKDELRSLATEPRGDGL